ncbi:MAG: alpha/beta hydrolase [Verrucomicrobiota bacterium]|jgi:hypothetical protein|nr:alpha/beta hydrolase [Verrucomicrobiota bacterium]
MEALIMRFGLRHTGIFAGLVCFLCLWSHLSIEAQLGKPPNTQRLPRSNLLLFRASNGIPVTITHAKEWIKRRKQILDGMTAVMGDMPDDNSRCNLDLRVLEETDVGSYIRQRITYQTEPGSRTPAYLCIPKRALQPGRKVKAALCLHPTDDRVGHKVVVGLGGRSGRQYAHELAERGWVTLSPAYPLLANYQPDLAALGYASGTMKAIWDNRRGLDLLASMPEVDASGFAAIGHSLGGHNAIYTAVLDERLQVVASSCGFDSFLDYKGGNILGWTSNRYMPRLLDYELEKIPFDFHELVAALAPRGLFISAPLGDTNFKWSSVTKVVRAARPVFQLLGQDDSLHLMHPKCGHDFPEEVRHAAYAFMEKTLKQGESH